ncbi:MAG: alkaline phosphatase family protein, partial [Cytophagales bacterium]|nr:alkaline phosphatase family protein [Cytophagales bacterium]
MKKTAVIDVVGLSESIISAEYTPFLYAYIQKKKIQKIKPPFPAVTTTSQSVYLTGKNPSEHGIVGNGWYDKIDSEVKFWKQSNALVGAEKIWEAAKKKDPNFTCA